MQSFASIRLFGITFDIRCASELILKKLNFDFGCFPVELPTVDSTSELLMSVRFVARAEIAAISGVKTLRCRRFYCFDRIDSRTVYYCNDAIVRFDFRGERAEIWACNEEIGYERLKFYMLSRIGEFLDKRGMHRVHGFGIETPIGGVLLTGPNGIGKTTLGMELLRRNPTWKLISDDSPLISRAGSLIPFAFRIGSRHDSEEHESAKVLLKANSVRLTSQQCAFVLIIAITDGIGAETPINAFQELLKWCFLGLGTPQVAEFFVRFHPKYLGLSPSIAWQRLQAVRSVARSARGYAVPRIEDRTHMLQSIEAFIE